MAKLPDYNPEIGDVVQADGMKTIFQVVEAPDSVGSTKVQPFSVSKQLRFGNVISVPRRALRLFKEDASQAAARIVREATENH
jgi:hypothetical protein